MKTTVIESMARAGDADVEPVITAWAKAGMFDEAAATAIGKSHAKGNSVTIIEDDIVYSLRPDGSRIELRKLVRPVQKIFTSTTIIIK